jgi:dTDP-4-dehydrorhamnose 3,5-epimerase
MESNIIDIEGVSITPIKKICHEKGDVYHALKSTEDSFTKFGEAYFTTVHKGDIKGWKKHTKMVMNLIVPVGEVGFYFHNRTSSKGEFIQVGLSNYVRVTVQPGIWVAFEGLKEELNLILNIASIAHDPNEAINVKLNTFPLLKKR